MAERRIKVLSRALGVSYTMRDPSSRLAAEIRAVLPRVTAADVCIVWEEKLCGFNGALLSDTLCGVRLRKCHRLLRTVLFVQLALHSCYEAWHNQRMTTAIFVLKVLFA